MSDFKLFSIKNDVVELPASQVSLEKELQTLLEKNMQTFFGVTFLRSEYKITNGRMDSIGIDENNCPVIFEYKRSLNENVINQGLFYLDWLLDHKANFQLLVMEVLGKNKADLIDWSAPCVICIANDFTKFDTHAVNQMQRNIKLVKYRKYGDDLITLEFLNTPQVQALVDDSAPLVAKNSKGDKTFRQHLEETSEAVRTLYTSIHDYILSLGDDISENQLKLYIAFKKVKNIVCIEVYQNNILLHLRLNPDTVTLQPGKIEDVRQSRKSLLDGAAMPLPGLSIDNGELTYKGKCWDCMSSAEQLKASTAIIRQLNPECGFVLIDKLEQMDLDTLREFGQWLESEGLQAIATRVSTGDECSLIIEDGEIKESPEQDVSKTTWKAGEF